MRKLYVFLPVFIFFLNASSQDTVEIKIVIEGETLAFANADLNTWSGYFVHAPYVRWSVSPTMYFDGWDDLYKGAKTFLETSSGHSAADQLHQINRSNWNIHINGSTASVKFVQVWEGNKNPSQQFRVLEKIDGTWKISMLVAVQ